MKKLHLITKLVAYLLKPNSTFACLFLYVLTQPCMMNESIGQAAKSYVKSYRSADVPNNYYGQILITRAGPVLVSASEFSFMMITGGNAGVFIFGLDNQEYGIKNLKSVFTGAPIKALAESSEGIIFFATAENQLTYFQNNESLTGVCDIPPFYFPRRGEETKTITQLWFDRSDNLYIGVTDGGFYVVPRAGSTAYLNPKNYKIGRNADSTMSIVKGEMPVKKVSIGAGTTVYSFAQNGIHENMIWIGSNRGLLSYDQVSGQLSRVAIGDSNLTVTRVEAFRNGDVWFGTLEKGMAVYHELSKTTTFFPGVKSNADTHGAYSIRDFCVKSDNSFFVALKDSVPAIFNTLDSSYTLIDDPSFSLSKNNTTNIRLDSTGNFYFIKGGLLFSAHVSDNPAWFDSDTTEITYTPLIYGVTDLQNPDVDVASFLTNPDQLKRLTRAYDQNSLLIFFTSNYFSKNKETRYAYKLDGDQANWVELPVYTTDNDSLNTVTLADLNPGHYKLRIRVKVGDGPWSKKEASMEIIIKPAWWATWWFWSTVSTGLILLVWLIIRARVTSVRRAEKLRAGYEKELLELEARALRAQMNPHFIFNCLNSIKTLMQEHENEKGVTYLTTFSKLIRTLFNNADKKQISLYDEIETCKFYLQLEAMRFDAKFHYSVNVNENIDLKSIQVPALIIQPFLENAIWHGIVPKEGEGNVSLDVLPDNGDVRIIIEDDGIGREASLLNKAATALTHQSKGVNLTQSRLLLDNLLTQRRLELDIVDKTDTMGKASGTRVTITIKEEV